MELLLQVVSFRFSSNPKFWLPHMHNDSRYVQTSKANISSLRFSECTTIWITPKGYKSWESFMSAFSHISSMCPTAPSKDLKRVMINPNVFCPLRSSAVCDTLQEKHWVTVSQRRILCAWQRRSLCASSNAPFTQTAHTLKHSFLKRHLKTQPNWFSNTCPPFSVVQWGKITTTVFLPLSHCIKCAAEAVIDDLKNTILGFGRRVRVREIACRVSASSRSWVD